ncbi:GNAT family N-acetyltransferase [Actinoallomurus sp. NBC_01490]|uniref:GNAT family N-acetyltransferase n=1 Tax=Actinoallomurus sp. NBC_01490 TaxID=2903557 RepID=UPI002E36C215|nr:GNAT family N-acetyltransferase [Actinoallomurus sp. NBC_01490]
MAAPTVTRATEAETPLVNALLSEAAGWLAARGVDQWPHPFPEDIVRASVLRRDTYLAWRDGDPVGTLAVYWADARFWGDRPPDAGYVHRLAVARAARGDGLGARLLDWAGELVAARGRRWLRLDCGAGNTALRAFYEHLGFQHVDDVEVTVPGAGTAPGPWTASLYQRRAEASERRTL